MTFVKTKTNQELMFICTLKKLERFFFENKIAYALIPLKDDDPSALVTRCQILSIMRELHARNDVR